MPLGKEIRKKKGIVAVTKDMTLSPIRPLAYYILAILGGAIYGGQV